MPRWKTRLWVMALCLLCISMFVIPVVIIYFSIIAKSTLLFFVGFLSGIVLWPCVILLGSLITTSAFMRPVVPGEQIGRESGEARPLLPNDATSSELRQSVVFAVDGAWVESLGNGQWRLHLNFKVINSDEQPVYLYDVRFHKYYINTGLSAMSVLDGAFDRLEIYDTNSIMTDGELYPITGKGEWKFELCPTVTRTPPNATILVLFGAFAFFRRQDDGWREFRTPSNGIFLLQDRGHLTVMNESNLPMYRKKHEKSLNMSLLVNSCENTLKKHLRIGD